MVRQAFRWGVDLAAGFLVLLLLRRLETPLHQEVHEPAAETAFVRPCLARVLEEQKLRRAVTRILRAAS